jgi:N-sulfoglucosamine sulfohydrolase
MQPITRRGFLRSAAAAAPLAACAATRRAALEPGTSLLVLVADDTSRVSVGAYGNRSATTPHIDRLAAEGLRFERGSTPVGICVPSRASMYTGLHPVAHGATGFEPIDPGVRTWPEYLAGANVATGMLGKLHVEPEARFPFEVIAKGETYTEWREPEAYERGFRDFLDVAGPRRFTAFINFRDPHRPFHKRDESEGGAPGVHAPEEMELLPFLYDTPETRLDLARYYDALKRTDDALGRVLDVLERSGRADSTLVVFTSDNGMPFPFAKSTLFEPGINLPFVVRWPGVVSPGRSAALVSLLDLLPTALELLELPPDDALHGCSLVPLLTGRASSVRDAVFATHTSQKVGHDYPVRSVRTARYKYLRNLRPEVRFDCSAFGKSITWKSWMQIDDAALAERMEALQFRPREQLFDLDADPWETANLAGDPAYARVQADLRARLRAWMTELDDPLLAEW